MLSMDHLWMRFNWFTSFMNSVTRRHKHQNLPRLRVFVVCLALGKISLWCLATSCFSGFYYSSSPCIFSVQKCQAMRFLRGRFFSWLTSRTKTSTYHNLSSLFAWIYEILWNLCGFSRETTSLESIVFQKRFGTLSTFGSKAESMHLWTLETSTAAYNVATGPIYRFFAFCWLIFVDNYAWNFNNTRLAVGKMLIQRILKFSRYVASKTR